MPARTPLVCLLDESKDSRSAWELAVQMARERHEALTAVLLLKNDMGNALQIMVRDSQKVLAENIEILSIPTSNGQQIANLIPKGLIIVGKDTADQLQIVSDTFTRNRSVIVVQGAGTENNGAAHSSAQLQHVPA